MKTRFILAVACLLLSGFACVASAALAGVSLGEVARHDLARCLAAVRRVPLEAVPSNPAQLERLNQLAATAQGKCTILPTISRVARSHRSNDALADAIQAVTTIGKGVGDFQQNVTARAVGSPFVTAPASAEHEIRLGEKLIEEALSD
jgi:hypothetical protein